MLAFLRRRPTTEDPAEPAAAPDADVVAEVPAHPCPTCGASLSDDQDWCHECGAAQPGRLGERPGWRAAAAVTGLTLALVGGAGVASYAAITQDPVPPPTTQAQVPPGTAPAPGTTPPGTQPAPGTEPAPGGEDPTVPTPSPQDDQPSQEVPDDEGGLGGGTGSGSSGSGTAGSTGSLAPDTSTSTTPAPSPPSTPTPPITPTTPAPDPTDDDPRPYDLPPGAVEVYDPDDRDAAIGAPGLAADDDDDTGFEVVLPPDGRPAGVGLLIDLDAPRDVTSVNIETSTPGFDVEVYGAARGIPREITSEGWQHIADAAAVDESERIPLGEAEGRIRRLVVWITDVPAADRRAVIDEVVVRVRPS